jgi:hypothetical protein
MRRLAGLGDIAELLLGQPSIARFRRRHVVDPRHVERQIGALRMVKRCPEDAQLAADRRERDVPVVTMIDIGLLACDVEDVDASRAVKRLQMIGGDPGLVVAWEGGRRVQSAIAVTARRARRCG